MSEVENWLPVAGFEGYYEVSDLGRVRSMSRIVPHPHGALRLSGRVLVPSVRRGPGPPYRAVSLSRDGRPQTRLVHHLVLEAFVCPRPPGLEGCHRNDDQADNSRVNLRWGNKPSNMLDAVRNGRNANASLERCLRGHLLRFPNLQPAPMARAGLRVCLACVRARNAASYARRHGLALVDITAVADQRYARIMRNAVAA